MRIEVAAGHSVDDIKGFYSRGEADEVLSGPI